MATGTHLHLIKELLNQSLLHKRNASARPLSVIELSDSDSSSSGDDIGSKKSRFLDPLPSSSNERLADDVAESFARQFWKAGDYEDGPETSHGGMDHVRVHPRFLHSNATSHKWVFGAFAELMDNSLDEVCNGATYVNIDMVKSKKDGSEMLLIEDNGGGMDPDKIRHCISLGYSAKSKMVDTIGQYGNGFKTSTMRLGADAIVFSQCHGKNGLRSTQSIGLLSYTFLRSTKKADTVVPMLDYERSGQDSSRIIRSSASEWDQNVETILQWSPFSSEADLLGQFNQMQDQGTRIIIYNIWHDNEGLLELDFDSDPHDIQIRGINRDEKSIGMEQKYPNSKHFLTYRHSLRSYAAILYLRIPPGFRIILRGEDVEHHNIVNDMMMSKKTSYRPHPSVDGFPKNSSMVAKVTVGFVKDAKYHIDVQGFNVYHKNRLIKPFWRVWHPTGGVGRGVIGVLEANFIKPAHDKQSFERTAILAKLETRLIHMQRDYWSSNCHKIGFALNRNKKVNEREISPSSLLGDSKSKRKSIALKGKTPIKFGDKGSNTRTCKEQLIYTDQSTSSVEYLSDDDAQNNTSRKHSNGVSSKGFSRKGQPSLTGLQSCQDATSDLREMSSRTTKNSKSKSKENVFTESGISLSKSSSSSLAQLKADNLKLQERLKRKEEEILGDLLNDLQNEKERSKSLEAQLQEETKRYKVLSKDQGCLVESFSEEKQRHGMEEENLRKKIEEDSNTIQKLGEVLKSMERRSSIGK